MLVYSFAKEGVDSKNCEVDKVIRMVFIPNDAEWLIGFLVNNGCQQSCH